MAQGDGRIFTRPRSPFWWIGFGDHGREIRQSTKIPRSRPKREARAFLRKRLDEAAKGRLPSFEERKLTIGALLDLYLAHLEIKGSRSVAATRSQVKSLRRGLGHMLSSADPPVEQLFTYRVTVLSSPGRFATRSSGGWDVSVISEHPLYAAHVSAVCTVPG